MKALIIRSIPLTTDTISVWHTQETKFLRRTRDAFVSDKIGRWFDVIINLGNVDLSSNHAYIINHPDTIKAASAPKALRNSLNDFLPLENNNGPHWHKGKGFAGDDKIYHENACSVIYPSKDVQAHINGQEYRILTCGNKIIQAAKKDNRFSYGYGVPSDFKYEWIGVEGVRKGGFIPLLRGAVELLPGGEDSFIGWDIIHDGEKPYIIEANFSPGVNEHTVKRLFNALEKE